jgi:hypothetical protein
MFTGLDWIRIKLELQGAQAYITQMRMAARSTLALSAAENETAAATARMNRAQYLHNQLLFTGRRLMFYGTLGFLALGASVAKLGFSYESTLQQARVALLPVLGSTSALNEQLNKLFGLAALSPFQFKDVVTGFTTFYKAAHLSGLGVDEVNRTLQNVTDALSAVPGKATAANLNRVTTAFQHMLNLGRPTGRLMQQLASLGIPIEAVLKKQLHLSDMQLRNIARSGITTRQVLDAFNAFIEGTKGYTGQAAATQLQTLTGAWSSFKDFLSQAAGGGEGGVFHSLTKLLAGVDIELGKITKTGKAATLTDVANALDKRVSPSTHIIVNLFITLQTALKTVIISFAVLFKVVTFLLKPLDFVASLFGANKAAAKLLGIVLGILITQFLLARTAMILFSFASILTTFSLKGLATMVRVLIGAEGLQMLSLALKRVIIGMIGSSIATSEFAAATRLMYGFWKTKGLIGIFRLLPTYLRLIAPGFMRAAAASWAFTASLLANPITWIVLAVVALTVGLVLLVTQVKSLNHWLKENYWWVSLLVIVLMGPFGLYIDAVVGLSLYWHRIADAIRAAYEWMKKLVTLKWVPGVGGGHGGFLSRLVNFASYTPLNPLLGPRLAARAIAHRQSGGYASGMTMVGEHGPEMLRLPQGSRVFNQTQVGAGFAGGGALVIKVVPQSIYLDGRKVGEAISTVVTGKEARG